MDIYSIPPRERFADLEGGQIIIMFLHLLQFSLPLCWHHMDNRDTHEMCAYLILAPYTEQSTSNKRPASLRGVATASPSKRGDPKNGNRSSSHVNDASGNNNSNSSSDNDTSSSSHDCVLLLRSASQKSGSPIFWVHRLRRRHGPRIWLGLPSGGVPTWASPPPPPPLNRRGGVRTYVRTSA